MNFRKLFILSIAILFSTQLKAQDPTFVWAKNLGGKSTDYVANGCIALDASKNIYTLGSFTDTADFNPDAGVNNLISAGNFDVFIAKLDSAGNYVWAKRIGGTTLDFATNIIAETNGTIYINGYVNGVVDLDPGTGTFFTTGTGLNGFIIKLNSNGDFIWGKEFNSNSPTLTLQVYFGAMTFAKDGGVLAGGTFGGTVDFDPGAGIANKTTAGDRDGFMLKLDTAGNFRWVKTFGSINEDGLRSIAIDTAGNVYSTGIFTSTVDFNPGTQVFNLVSAGSFDVFIQKLDTGGNFIWAKKMGGTFSDYGNAITIDNAGNIYTTGRFSGVMDFDPGASTYNLTSMNNPTDVFISKLDKNGNFRYAQRKGDTLADNSFAIMTDLLGNVYVLGEFSGTVNFNQNSSPSKIFTAAGGSDIFFLKLDSTGVFYGAQQTSASSQERAYHFAFDQNEDLYIAGYFNSTMDADPGTGISTITSNGDYDVYIQKLSQADAHAKYCNGTTTLTSAAGTFDDGSGSKNYGNYQNCSWLIQPVGASTINLKVDSIATEASYDVIKVYNGPNASSTLIGNYSGTNIPPTLVSSGNSLFVTFTTDGNTVSKGFQISYSTNTPTPPVANFSSSSQNIVTGNSINFTDLSTNLATSWNWTFTGAASVSSSLQNPINVVYNSAGCYQVRLIATNQFGSDTMTKTCYINVVAPTPCSELFISKYIEGSGLNKAIEIYNGSNSSINLSSYQLKLFSNGNTVASNSLSLAGTISPYGVYVITNPSASSSILAIANITSNVCSFNGNDAVVLFKNATAIDAIGIVGNDPGFSWQTPGGSTIDFTLVRKDSISYPSTNWSLVQNQWNVFPQDNISNLGLHNSFCTTHASFTYSTPVCENNAVTFTSTSLNAVTYLWSFQGGTPASSTQANPVVQFSGAGIKSVSLIVYNGTYTDTETVQINVVALPNAAVTANSPTAFCSGGSVTFTANNSAGLSYQWQKNSVDISGATANNYTTTLAGDYRVIVTNTAGCQAISSIQTVIVYSKPAAVLTANGSTSICNGDSVLLSASVGIGYSYVWKKDNAIISGAGSATYYAKSVGAYKVIVSNANGCTKTSNSITVTINILAATVTALGATTVCNGAGVTLKANTGPGLSYQWKKGANSIAGAIDSVYIAYVSGTYKVTVTGSCGTATSTGISVVVNSVPTASISAGGSVNICNGTSVILNANTAVGLKYQWKKNGNDLLNDTLSSYTASVTGTYTVVTKNSSGCTALSNSIAVTVFTVSASVTAGGPTTFCTGDSVVLAANSGTNLSYQWLKGSNYIAGATAISYTTKTAGTYKVKVTNTVSGCSKSSSGVQVVVNCRTGEENELTGTAIIPNPFGDFATLSFTDKNAGDVSVTVINAEGKIIEEITASTNQEIILGKNLASGIYMAIVKKNNSRKMLRLTKF